MKSSGMWLWGVAGAAVTYWFWRGRHNATYNAVMDFSGSQTDAIRAIQTALRDQGYSPGAIDGVEGPQTVDAFRRWIAAHPAVAQRARAAYPNDASAQTQAAIRELLTMAAA